MANLAIGKHRPISSIKFDSYKSELSMCHSWIHESADFVFFCIAEAMRELGRGLRKSSAEGFIVSGASVKSF